MRILLTAIWLCLFLWLLGSLLYHYTLLACAAVDRRRKPVPMHEQPLFAVLAPAHDEELVIGQTVQHLRRQTYPAERYDVYVVADHCSDGTADVARTAGALVLERTTGERGRKAFALQWGLAELLAMPRPYDAIVVIDADSLLDADGLRAFAPFVAAGRPVIQGQHLISNPASSRFAALADVDMRLNNLLRNQAKSVVGLSARLMGDAMCFRREVIERFGWPTESLGEDREFGLHLLLHGIRVVYAPDAVSRGQAAQQWKDATRQRVRWYGGAQSIQRRYLGPLLRRAIVAHDLAALDMFLELALPPYSMSMALSGVLLAAQLAFPSVSWGAPSLCAAIVLAAWLAFPVLGLLVARAPAATFAALWIAPVYIAWRLFASLSARARGRHVQWVRTRRSEELHDPR